MENKAACDSPIPIDQAELDTYARTLEVDRSSATSLAQFFLRSGAVHNFKNVMASGLVRDLNYDTRLQRLAPDAATEVLKALSSALESQKIWGQLLLAGIPHIPENAEHTEARGKLISALGQCSVDQLSLFGNTLPDEFIGALTPEQRFNSFDLSTGPSPTNAHQVLLKLSELLERGQISHKLKLFVSSFNGNAVEKQELRTVCYARLKDAVGKLRSLHSLSLVCGFDLALAVIDSIKPHDGPWIDTVKLGVNTPIAEVQAEALVESMTELLKRDVLTGIRLALPNPEILTAEHRRRILQAAIGSKSLCQEFSIIQLTRGIEDPSRVDVDDVSEVIHVEEPNKRPGVGKLDSLINELGATLQRNREHTLKYNKAFVAGAAGNIPFFGSGDQRFRMPDIGPVLAGKLEFNPSQEVNIFKRYDLGGLHLVSKSALAGAQGSRSKRYLQQIQKLLKADPPAVACQEAIAHLRTLWRAGVLMEEHRHQAFDEIGVRANKLGLFGPREKLAIRRNLVDWATINWFKDMRSAFTRPLAEVTPSDDFSALSHRV